MNYKIGKINNWPTRAGLKNYNNSDDSAFTDIGFSSITIRRSRSHPCINSIRRHQKSTSLYSNYYYFCLTNFQYNMFY